MNSICCAFWRDFIHYALILWCGNVKTSLKKLVFEAAVDRAPAFLLLFDCSKFANNLSRKLHVFSQIIGISFLFWGYLPFHKKLDFIRHSFNPKSSHFLLDFSYQRVRISLYFLPHLIFSCTIVETDQNCFAIYSTYCESGRSSVFIAAFSCLEMGPTEQRQYFTVAWQAAAKVFTASLQCGKMDPGREAQAEAWVTLERAHLALSPLIIFIFYINSVFY